MECGSWAVVGYTEDGVTVVHPLACRSWSCLHCSKRNKRKLLHRLGAVKTHSLLTLTCRPNAHKSPEEAFLRMSIAVNHLFKRIRRQWPDSEIAYFLVWERTKKGYPHAHLLLRAPFLPQHWLSAAWFDLTGAPVVDIRQVSDNNQVVAYVAKYLSKDPHAPQGMKRYRCSQNFFDGIMPAETPSGSRITTWHLVKRAPQELLSEFQGLGYGITEDDNGSFHVHPPGHPSAPAVASIERQAAPHGLAV